MVGRCYTWRSGACSEGVWRVVCRWASIPGVKVIRNVKVEKLIPISEWPKGPQHALTISLDNRAEVIIGGVMHVPTGEWTIRPWYPAPRRVECST